MRSPSILMQLIILKPILSVRCAAAGTNPGNGVPSGCCACCAPRRPSAARCGGTLQRTGKPLQPQWNFEAGRRTCGPLANAYQASPAPDVGLKNSQSGASTTQQMDNLRKLAAEVEIFASLTQMSDAFDRTERSEIGPKIQHLRRR